MGNLLDGDPEERLRREQFNLKLQSKQLNRQAQKFEKEHQKYKKKVKEALSKGQIDIAKIHAETAIHKRSMGNKLINMASKIDAVEMRLNSTQQMKKMSKLLAGVSNKLGETITEKDLTRMQLTMDKFSTQFEDLNIQSKVMESQLDTGTSTMYNQSQVDNLLQQIAEENAMDVKKLFDQAGIGKNKIKPVKHKDKEEIKLEQRLNALQN